VFGMAADADVHSASEVTRQWLTRVSGAGACFLMVIGPFGCGAPSKATKRASPYNRSCGTAREGFSTINDQWESRGPWHVRMSYATARNIAARVGPNEFEPPDSHPPPQNVPCVVASSVAFVAANAWSVRRATNDWISAAWASYASGPSFGRFHCIVTSRPSDNTSERCTHRADRHAGRIIVGLVIRRTRKSP
jgi:hypothetical protein